MGWWTGGHTVGTERALLLVRGGGLPKDDGRDAARCTLGLPTESPHLGIAGPFEPSHIHNRKYVHQDQESDEYR
jgi:hypothetical protein